jgi:uncharacterized membrane protein YphA (DoxX/SURF4 family)
MILGFILIFIGIFLIISSWKKNKYYLYFQSLFKNEFIIQKARLILILVAIASIVVGYFLAMGIIAYQNPFIAE